ncbi:MAG: energy-coupling factor transporter transmembrane protein EcfT [Bryobacteraceae bacterium]
MHHAVLDEWSRRESPVHRRDARAKLIALAAFLVAVATAQRQAAGLLVLDSLLLIVWAAAARIPLAGALARAAVVLPFSLAFAGMTALAGDPQRAWMLLAKSYVSGLAVLLLVATTPVPKLLRGLESLGTPGFLVMVTQFIYRYLFVLSEEAQHMRIAALSRGMRRMPFRAAAGAAAVLFARAHSRAAAIHHAMLARGFDGSFRTLTAPRFGWKDGAFTLAAAMAPLALRFTVGGGIG